MREPLKDCSIHHAGLKPVFHPRLQTVINGQTAVRYLRFLRPVTIDQLELRHERHGRWVPGTPTHPAHLIISVRDPRTGHWDTVREVNLPPDPRITGRGINQRLTVEQMNAHFDRVLKDAKHIIRLGGLKTAHLRVECDREHPVWPNHGECNGGPFNVPFGILNSLKAFGNTRAAEVPEPKHFPVLRVGAVRPAAPKGMRVRQEPLMLVFAGRKLSVGFSLRRPILLHLGWDVLGESHAARNRLTSSYVGSRSFAVSGGLSGPLARTLHADCLPNHWTGEVRVTGNRVSYRNLHSRVDGLRFDATFTVEPDRLILELTQTCDQPIPALEAEAWRFAWDLQAAMTATAGKPTLRPGRNGEVELPTLWAADDAGCLSCRPLAGKPRLQIESYRHSQCVTAGLVLAPAPGPDSMLTLPAGTTRATIEMGVTALEPKWKRRDRVIQRYWSGIYSCYRAEYGGFSNHAASVNCHVNQHCPNELVAMTRRHPLGVNPLDCFRFTIERGLLDGGGYGYWRNLYLDSDPMLVSGAGRIHQVEPRRDWLRKIEPGLVEAAERMLGALGKEGLAICRDLSGNTGSYRWSSNAMDVVGFGHMDAYVNAWTYRALRNATALLTDLNRSQLARRCRQAAARLRTAYPKYLVNPKTGWVVGWRSRDGELHDAAFTWVNAPACAFGLLDRAAARRALLGLERLRLQAGAGSGVCGVPFNLRPIPRGDHMLPKMMMATMPTFELYTDGAMAACFAGTYLRALSINGLQAQAGKLARELAEGYAAGLWTGGNGTGVEFRSWDGLATGYEGSFVANFSALYAIAVEKRLIAPPHPEWWPADG